MIELKGKAGLIIQTGHLIWGNGVKVNLMAKECLLIKPVDDSRDNGKKKKLSGKYYH